MISTRNNRSVVFYLLYAQAGAADDAATVATSRIYYKVLVNHDKELLCALAQAYARLGKPDLALVEINRALALPMVDPADNKTAYRLKGELLTGPLNRKKEGEQCLAKSAALAVKVAE